MIDRMGSDKIIGVELIGMYDVWFDENPPSRARGKEVHLLIAVAELVDSAVRWPWQ